MQLHDGKYQTVPLTDDDKGLLDTIYRTRLRIFVGAYAALCALALYASFGGSDVRDRYTGKIIQRWEEQKDHFNISRMQMWYIKIAWLEGIMVTTAIVAFVKKIEPFKKDIKNGVKEAVPFQIVRKEYFEYTGQYFVALDDPKYLHHEVDEGTYAKCNEGDTMALYRAPKSKYVFENNGRFTLM